MAKKFLSREEYLDKQRQAIIEQSIKNSRNRILPAVPLVLKESEKEWKENINKLIEVAKSGLNDAIQYNHGKDKVDDWQNELNRLNDKLNKGYTEELCTGASCIYTATDNYGKKYRVSGNKTFRANPTKYGFEEINLNDIKPGDIIQDFGPNGPRHALTFVGYDDTNKALFNYSKGGSNESEIVKNGHYGFEWDELEPTVHLDGINNDKLRHTAAAYRFIGTEDDNKLWNENYNKERSDWSKQVVEELRKVPTLTLPNQVQMMKFGGMKQDKVFKLKGGVAIPLDDKKRLFYLSGAKHEQGGIDVTPELEAEGGEVVKINPKSIKVVTAQKIMGGKSPAELVVDASSTGKSEKVFNKVFDYQENFKDRHNLNDDGTKKAQFGKEKSIDEMNSEMLFLPTKKENIGQNKNTLVYKTYPKNHVEVPRRINIEKDLVAGLHDITNDIIEGKYSLYQNHSYHKNRFLKDKQSGKIYEDIFSDIDPIDLSYFDITPYSEIRKMLPKRDYIGGSKRDVGIKVINKVPGMKDEILRLSELYGISPNVFTQRLINEGWVQDQAKLYNRTSVKHQKEYRWDLMNDFVDGFNTLGLDTFGDHHKKGHLNLRRDIKYDDHFTTNEDGSGRVYNSADFDNMYDALEAKAAMIEYLTKLGKKKGHTGSDLDAWVNAAYNMGEYHKDLNNMNYVRQKYGVKPFYRYGGEMKNKKKANLGIFQDRPYGIFNKPLVDVNIGYDLPKISNIGMYSDSKFADDNKNQIKSAISTPQIPIQTSTNNTNRSSLNLDFLNEITNPNGSTYNVKTGQTYFKDWNRVRRTPYSSLNLKTGETEYAGFINPYGSEIQSSVYNNGPQGRQERTAKERLLNAGDWINIGANALGATTNLLTGLLTPDIKYARMKDPIPIMAPKINSNVNTTAEEDAINEAYNDEIRAINENTADSKTALNRKRNAAVRKRQAKVKVRSAAENTSRDLINKGNILKGEYDKFNIQRQENVDAYNKQADAAEFNANRTKVSDAITGFLSDLTGSASTITNAIERRQADKRNTVLSYLANPNVDPTKFKEGYDKVYAELYPSKTKTRNKSKKNNTQS